MKLTPAERWILSNQCRILSKLYPEEREGFERVQKVVEYGYEIAYDWYTEHISSEGVSAETSQEVIAILTMFDALKISFNQLADKSEVEESSTQFLGFSGNDESGHWIFTRFLCEDEGKWSDLHVGDGYNSHFPMLPKYRAMLARFKTMAERYKLTAEQIKQVTGAN